MQYTFSGELPPACRALYETVLSCELDTEFETGTMESRLSDAIRWVTSRAANERSRNFSQNAMLNRHSMTTPGCLLHSTLRNKSYLRITLGPGARESPGSHHSNM